MSEPAEGAPRTLIMGIVNVTPDSFSDGGRFAKTDAAIAHGMQLAADGAAWIDVGGESTRPGAQRIDAEVELARVLPVVRELAAAGVAVSIDTLNAETALRTVEAGARLVNDVSGGLADERMLAAIAATGAEVALGHWRGLSDDMYARAQYDDVVREVASELHARAEAAIAAGIDASRIVIDPGIGFAKDATQNWQVLGALPHFVASGFRVLLGTSRKKFLTTMLAGRGGLATRDGLAPGDSLAPGDDLAARDVATAMTSGFAAAAGAWGVRVHDVSSTRIALDVARAWQSGARASHPKENHGSA